MSLQEGKLPLNAMRQTDYHGKKGETLNYTEKQKGTSLSSRFGTFDISLVAVWPTYFSAVPFPSQRSWLLRV